MNASHRIGGKSYPQIGNIAKSRNIVKKKNINSQEKNKVG